MTLHDSARPRLPAPEKRPDIPEQDRKPFDQPDVASVVDVTVTA